MHVRLSEAYFLGDVEICLHSKIAMYRTTGFHGYSVQFSPFNGEEIACSASQNYGISGLHLFGNLVSYQLEAIWLIILWFLMQRFFIIRKDLHTVRIYRTVWCSIIFICGRMPNVASVVDYMIKCKIGWPSNYNDKKHLHQKIKLELLFLL